MQEIKQAELSRRSLAMRSFSAIKRDGMAWLLILPSLVLFILFVWQPLIQGVILSFFETKGYDAVVFAGFKNYSDICADPAFQMAFFNTFKYLFWSLVLGYLVPIVVALVLSEMIHMSGFLRFSVYFPSIVPGIATALMWTFILEPGSGGIMNALLEMLGLPMSQFLQDSKLTIPIIIITMTWKGFGATAIVYLASLQGINQELYEAAITDGAGIWARIKYITIPQISSILSLMFIMQVISVFQVMGEPLAMTDGGPNNASITLMLQSYFYGFRYGEAGKSMAVSTITFIVLMILTTIYFKVKKKIEND